MLGGNTKLSIFFDLVLNSVENLKFLNYWTTINFKQLNASDLSASFFTGSISIYRHRFCILLSGRNLLMLTRCYLCLWFSRIFVRFWALGFFLFLLALTANFFKLYKFFEKCWFCRLILTYSEWLSCMFLHLGEIVLFRKEVWNIIYIYTY